MARFLNQRRKPLTPEQTAENARLKAERDKATMTCQCCGKRYLANTGTIAHHGYQRPGGGWQTASCMGAKYQPFESSRDRLGDLIAYLTKHRAGMRAALVESKAERTPIERSYKKRSADAWKKAEVITVSFTRATWDAMLAERRAVGLYGTFDDLKTTDIGRQARQIAAITQEITHQQERFAAFKQTHRFVKETKEWKRK